MSKRDWKLLEEDMLESMNRIESYTHSITSDEFFRSQLIIDAVVRNLEIIGEAAKHVPEQVMQQFPQIPWHNIIGLRNRVIHEYFGVDTMIIWHIVQNELKELKAKLEAAVH